MGVKVKRAVLNFFKRAKRLCNQGDIMSDPKFAFAWLITKDNLADCLDESFNRVGKCRVYGRKSPGVVKPLIEKDGQRFRLLDDDGIITYEGLMLDPTNESSGFEPLDWAMNDAGCTSIEYYDKGRWLQL